MFKKFLSELKSCAERFKSWARLRRWFQGASGFCLDPLNRPILLEQTTAPWKVHTRKLVKRTAQTEVACKQKQLLPEKQMWTGLLPYARAYFPGMRQHPAPAWSAMDNSLQELFRSECAFQNMDSLAFPSKSRGSTAGKQIRSLLKHSSERTCFDFTKLRWAYDRYFSNNNHPALTPPIAEAASVSSTMENTNRIDNLEKSRLAPILDFGAPNAVQHQAIAKTSKPHCESELSQTVSLVDEEFEAALLELVEKLEAKLRDPQPHPSTSVRSASEEPSALASQDQAQYYCLLWLTETARQSNAPPNVLRRLAQCPVLHVRIAVATNERAPEEALSMLAIDLSSQVRCAVAQSSHTPVELLECLSNDSNCFVAMRAKETLRRVHERDERHESDLRNGQNERDGRNPHAA